MKNDFDGVARAYDAIAFAVFGSRLQQMRSTHLPLIRAGSRVLILGGGTGACLEDLPAGCEADFVDLSQKMITKAKRRRTKAQVAFICTDFLTWEPRQTYDFVLAPFFLDAFVESRLLEVLKKIRTAMWPGGTLVITDFRPSRTLHHRFLLWVMHRFFGATANLESKELLDLHALTLAQGFVEKDFQTSKQRFIYSAIYGLDTEVGARE